jgi:hypothetical protein
MERLTRPITHFLKNLNRRPKMRRERRAMQELSSSPFCKIESINQDSNSTLRTPSNRMTDDFDYIGTGGFCIECSDGETLGVTKEESVRIQQRSIFFRNCFRHGTVESSMGIIKKPDWSLAVARHVVEALAKESTTLPNLNIFRELVTAADQACMDLRLCNSVNYRNPVLTENSNMQFFHLVNPENYKFSFRGNIKHHEWLELLEDNILLNRKETEYVVTPYFPQDHTNSRHRGIKRFWI